MGMSALMIPELPSRADLVKVEVSQAAHDHLLAWSASQRLVALHESGHLIGAAASPTKVPARAVDITLRHGGNVMLGGSFEDTSLQWDSRARMLDNLMIAMAGGAAERQVLGQHTTGCETDYDTAVSIAMRFIKCGFGGPGLFVGEDGLPHSYLTPTWKDRTLGRIQELVAEAEAAADAVIERHQDELIVVATAVHEHRRLSDDRLDALLESVGFVLPRATA